MLTSGSNNHNQNRYQAVVGTRTRIDFGNRGVFLMRVSPHAVSLCCECCFPPPPYCLPIDITMHLLLLCVWCYSTLLQSSSKPLPWSSSSSLSRHLQPLKVVNRKRPLRDDWKNYSSPGGLEGDGGYQDVDQDICIKVRQTDSVSSSSTRWHPLWNKVPCSSKSMPPLEWPLHFRTFKPSEIKKMGADYSIQVLLRP